MPKIVGSSNGQTISRKSRIERIISGRKKGGVAGSVKAEASPELADFIKSCLVGVVINDQAPDEQFVVAFVKASLMQEFGSEITSDQSYLKLQQKIVSQIEDNEVLHKKIVAIVKGVDS